MAINSPSIEVVDLDQYHSILESVRERKTNLFSRMNLGTKIENGILLQWIRNPQISYNVDDFIDSEYPKVVESYFADLRNACFKYCLKKTNDFEISEDIAQEAIYQLLKSQQLINNVGLWLRGVVINLLAKTYRNNHKKWTMCKALASELRLLTDIFSCSDDTLINSCELLDNEITLSKEYCEYKCIKEYNSLSQYATAKGITYQKAKQVSKEIQRNFKALCLRHYGWEDSPDILSFNQLKSLQRYLRQLIHYSSPTPKPVIRKNSLTMKQSELKQLFSEYNHIDDWGIHMIGKNNFRIHIFCKSGKSDPICATIIISIKDNNRIVTESCKSNRLASILTIPTNINIPKEKGKSALTFEQIKTILSE